MLFDMFQLEMIRLFRLDLQLKVEGKPKIIVQQLSDIWQDIKEPRNLK